MTDGRRPLAMFFGKHYECPACHAGFRKVDDLRDHGLTVHAGASEATR